MRAGVEGVEVAENGGQGPEIVGALRPGEVEAPGRHHGVFDGGGEDGDGGVGREGLEEGGVGDGGGVGGGAAEGQAAEGDGEGDGEQAEGGGGAGEPAWGVRGGRRGG